MAKAQTKDILNSIKQTDTISEQEMKLLKNRINAGEKIDGLDYGEDIDYTLPKGYEEKGMLWILRQYRTPKGKVKGNHPFGYREQDAIETMKKITFVGFHNSSFWGKNYQPVYNVKGKDASFDYCLSGGKLEILG